MNSGLVYLLLGVWLACLLVFTVHAYRSANRRR